MAEISKTTDQALVLLGAVSERQPVTAAELSRSLGLNRTIAHRLLATLHGRGFVRRVGEDYLLGPAALHIAGQVEPALRAAAQPVMERLCAEVNETVVLQVVDAHQAVILAQVISRKHVVRVEQNLIMSRHPLHLGASGRVLLAFQPEPFVRRVLARLPDGDSVRIELARIREDGYAVSHDELQWGVHAASAPVLRPDGVAAAALAVLAPATRAELVRNHIPPLCVAAAEISAALAGALHHPTAVVENGAVG
jgi:DNA-binding IclR family transcriptional regulator